MGCCPQSPFTNHSFLKHYGSFKKQSCRNNIFELEFGEGGYKNIYNMPFIPVLSFVFGEHALLGLVCGGGEGGTEEDGSSTP